MSITNSTLIYKVIHSDRVLGMGENWETGAPQQGIKSMHTVFGGLCFLSQEDFPLVIKYEIRLIMSDYVKQLYKLRFFVLVPCIGWPDD